VSPNSPDSLWFHGALLEAPDCTPEAFNR